MKSWLRYLRSRKDYVRIPYEKMKDFWIGVGGLVSISGLFVILIWYVLFQIHPKSILIDWILFYWVFFLSIFSTFFVFLGIPLGLYSITATHVAIYKHSHLEDLQKVRAYTREMNLGENGGGI